MSKITTEGDLKLRYIMYSRKRVFELLWRKSFIAKHLDPFNKYFKKLVDEIYFGYLTDPKNAPQSGTL